MKKIILATSFFIGSLLAGAQSILPKQLVSVGLSASVNNGITSMSMPVVYSHQIAGKPQFRYLVGVRQNLAYGQTEFKINKQETLIDDLSNYSINVMGGFEYISSVKLLAGFNVELIGGTIGTRSYKTVGKDPIYYITPEPVNIILSQGSLRSEFYIGYNFTDYLSLKAGLTHIRLGLYYSNLNTNQTSVHTNLYMPFINMQYTLWQQ